MSLALMFGAGPCDAPGNDLAPFSDELLECFGVFVINFHGVVHAEPANFTALIESVFSAASMTFIHT